MRGTRLGRQAQQGIGACLPIRQVRAKSRWEPTTSPKGLLMPVEQPQASGKRACLPSARPTVSSQPALCWACAVCPLGPLLVPGPPGAAAYCRGSPGFSACQQLLCAVLRLPLLPLPHASTAQRRFWYQSTGGLGLPATHTGRPARPVSVQEMLSTAE